MPAFDVLIVLFVFCGPGMLFWFFEGQAKHLRQERPFWLQVALGALVTLSYYAVLEGFGCISLSSIINKEGKVDARLIVGTSNIAFYFITVGVFSLAGFFVGKRVSDRIEVGLKGKDSKTTWMHAFGLTSEKYGYATLYTKSGDVWWGYLCGLPDVPDPADVIMLQDVQFQHAGSAEFMKVDADMVVVPMGDLKAISMKYVSYKKELQNEEKSGSRHRVEITAAQYFESAEFIEYFESFESFDTFRHAYRQFACAPETIGHRATNPTVAGQSKGVRFAKREINLEED